MARAMMIGKETTYGEDVGLTKSLNIIDESISLDAGVIGDHDVSGRGKQKPQMGNFNPSGGFSMYVEPENIGLLLLALCGKNSLSTTDLTGGEYRHDYVVDAVPQYLTVGVLGDVAAGQRTYPGWAMKSAKLSLSPGEKLLAEFDGFGKTVNLDALASPSFSTLQPFVYHQGDAKIATVSNTDIKAMTMEITNNWAEEDYTIGSQFRRRAPLQGLEVKGTMDILYEDLDEVKTFLGGDGAQVAPASTLKKRQLDLDIDLGTQIAVSNNYQLNFEFLEVVFKTEKANVVKRDRVIQNVEWEAFAPVSGNQFKIELFNGVASY